jgi:hypothetical protein
MFHGLAYTCDEKYLDNRVQIAGILIAKHLVKARCW